MMSSVVLAKALYSNESEADDELSFKKGDVITVLETDFEGMVGWWLCSLGDRQGVAPGNRLQLISFDDNDPGDPRDVYDTPGPARKERYGDVDYDIPKSYPASEYEDYAIPKAPYSYPVPDSQRHGFVLPSPHAVSSCTERNSNSSDGLVTNEIYAAPPSRWSSERSERSSDEFRFSGGSGSEEMYDVPSRNSLESDDGQRTLQVPDIPPKGRAGNNGYHDNMSDFGNSMNRQGSQEIYDSPAGTTQTNGRYSNNSDVYDQLPKNNDEEKVAHALLSDNDDYDTVPSSHLAEPQDIYDVPQTASEELYDTLPHGPEEDYDVPPTGPEELYDIPPVGPQEVYDVPPTGPDALYDELPEKSESLYKRNSFDVADGNNNPPVFPESKGNDSVAYDEHLEGPEALYDNFAEIEKKTAANTGSLGKKKRHESDDYVDYQEIYGMGKDEQTEKEHEAIEQSVLNRIHMDKVRELRISHLVAMQNLDKLQQAVDVAVTKLMSFVTDDWRRSEVYALNINGIREISGKVKVALRLLTEFGLGALKSSQQLTENEISGKIEEALKPLLESYYSIKNAIQQLDESNWRSAYQEKPDDDLNTIAKLAQCIPCGAYNLGAVIANYSNLLFTEEAQNGTSCATPREIISEPQNGTQNLLNPSTAQATEEPKASPPSGPVNPSPVTAKVENIQQPTPRKVESKPQANHFKPLTKTPPAVSPKPKKDRKRSESAPNSISLSEQVSELTHNLLNQIDNIKTPPSGLSRKGSKKLSPKTVRRLCSITLKDDDRINEKIFEDVTAIPPKPSRQSSTPALPDNQAVDKRSSLTGTMSLPGVFHSAEDILQRQNSFETLKSFVEKMNSEFVVLKEGIKSFGESVREREKPKVFVAHSKFIVLSAHKLVYFGDAASRSTSNFDDRNTISTQTNSLSEVIKDFVENIKVAARQYPEEEAMNTMIKSATSVTEKAVGLYKELKRLARS